MLRMEAPLALQADIRPGCQGQALVAAMWGNCITTDTAAQSSPTLPQNQERISELQRFARSPQAPDVNSEERWVGRGKQQRHCSACPPMHTSNNRERCGRHTKNFLMQKENGR